MTAPLDADAVIERLGLAEPRRLVAARGLVGAAVAALTRDALSELPFEALAPTKALLKRFFSAEEWGPDHDEALAAAIGPGEGRWTEALEDDLTMAFGWDGGRFRLRVEASDGAASAQAPVAPSLESTFAGPIAPEATPNPRTIVFRTGPLHQEESRSYRSAAEAAGDPRVARLFAREPDVATVLVARDFVAVTLRRADRWESVLAPVLDAVTEGFAGAGPVAGAPAVAHVGPAVPASGVAPQAGTGAGTAARPQRETRLDRAWRELGGLRAGEPAELERILAAARSTDPAARQVAAGLVTTGPPGTARETWDALATDTSRVVRRAALDAMVDAGRGDLRPLLERALADDDAWVRWKALRGLAELGAAASRPAVEALAEDPDFRVRLEARSALRAGG